SATGRWGAGAKGEGEGVGTAAAAPGGGGGDTRGGGEVRGTLGEPLQNHRPPPPPISLLFAVREESGIQGCRYMDPTDLNGATMGFNIDSRLAADLITGAVGQEYWDVDIIGKAAHAGLAPEKGISSTLVAAVALTEARRNGWF